MLPDNGIITCVCVCVHGGECVCVCVCMGGGGMCVYNSGHAAHAAGRPGVITPG